MLFFTWLVGCFGFNGPLRQYFSLYRAVLQREGERRERTDESKNVQTTLTRTYCKHNRPCPTVIQTVGRPGTGSLPSTIAPPDHPVILQENMRFMSNKYTKRMIYNRKKNCSKVSVIRALMDPIYNPHCFIRKSAL